MQKSQILLIEDTETVRDVLTRQLEALGMAVTALDDGDHVKRELDKTKYDLVIADLHLPNCSGFDIARFANAKNCKVILLSGDTNVALREDLLTAQFDQILTKPVSLQNLKDMLVKHHLLDAETDEGRHLTTDSIYDESGALNLTLLEEQMGQLDSVALQMLARFPVMMRPLVQQIMDCASLNKPKIMFEVAHSLKGAAQSAGAVHLGYIANMIQESAANQMIDPDQIKALELEFEKVEKAIHALCHPHLTIVSSVS